MGKIPIQQSSKKTLKSLFLEKREEDPALLYSPIDDESTFISDEILQRIIKMALLIELMGLFLPWILVLNLDETEWIALSGFGLPVNWKDPLFSPTLFILGLFFLYQMHTVWQQSDQPVSWLHLKPAIIGFFVFAFQLLSKRLEAVIFLKPSFVYRTAMCGTIPPHGSIGLLLAFFSFIVQNGAIFARAQLYADDWFLSDPKINKYTLQAVFMYLTPFYISYNQGTLRVLLGIGYGFKYTGDSFYHGVAFIGGLANLFQVSLLLIIIGNSKNIKVKVKYIRYLLLTCFFIFASMGYMFWRIYVPSSEVHEAYPPIFPTYFILYWIFANLGWESIVLNRRYALQKGTVKKSFSKNINETV